MAVRRSARPRPGSRKTAAKPVRKVARKLVARTVRKAVMRRASPKRRATSGSRPARDPAPLRVLMHHLSYNSHELDQIRRFYTETLGFADFGLDEAHGYLAIHTGPGASLGFMPPLPGPPEQWRPPREPALHLVVDDVDRAYRLLTARGVTFEQGPTDRPWGHRTAVLRDPEGRLLSLAQPITRRRTGR